MSDRVLGGVGLALAIFYIWAAQQIELSFISDTIGPRTFPIIIGVILGIASLYFLLRPDPDPEWPALARLLEIGAATAVMLGYALLLPALGFLVSTAIASGYFTWRLGTTPKWAGVVGALTSAGIYLVFSTILGLTLARGPFGF